MNDGYIKLHRKVLENPVVCRDSDHLAVWIYLLLNATHKNYDAVFAGKRISLLPGQLITGRKSIGIALKINESKVQRILSAFKSEQQIEQRTSTRNRLISILNWSLYQTGEQQIEPVMNNKRTTSEHKQEYKKERNIYSADFEQFWSTYPRQKDKQAACKCWLARIKDGFTADELIRAASVYAAECTGKDPQFIKHPKTYLAPNGPFTECLNQQETIEPISESENVPTEYTKPWSCISDYHSDSGGRTDE